MHDQDKTKEQLITELHALRLRLAESEKDKTERKRAQEALRESEELHRTLVSLSPDAITVADLNGWLTFASPKARQIFGHSPDDEVLGRSLWDYVVPEEQEKAYANILDLLTGGTFADREYTLIKQDGTRFIGEINAAVIDCSDGSPMRMIIIIRDITERKRAADELLESENKFKSFAENALAGIYLLQDGVFKYVSPKFAQMFGYTVEECLNGLHYRNLVYKEDLAKVDEQIRIRTSGEVEFIHFTARGLKKSGQIFHVEVYASTGNYNGSPAATGTILDITDRKRTEEERKKLEEQLFQSQKMESVGRLAGGVAHDFNNMLGVIIGRAEMALQKDVSNAKFQHNLKEILKAGQRSAGLTRQLLAFACKQTAIPKILDLNDTISGMLKMLRRLIAEDIKLSWQPGLDLWEVKIDPSQVDQILANLVVNARDAISGAGAVTMMTHNVAIDDCNKAEISEFIPGEYVLLTVSDTGTGMSREVRENIFEPFFTTKEVGVGTGLGLSTVYGIVKQNDGFIYVASESGKGTTFKIYLPRFVAETADVPCEEVACKPPTGTETILLVEDDEAILSLSKMILENLGYTVLAAHNPTYVFHLVEDHPGDIHLLITDVVMPEMNGRELAEQLITVRPNLKCLYMSGYTADVIARRGILDEGVNFIQKPFGSEVLAARVRQALDHLE
ncbi:PAS/PAC sensor hybrid histidine kinase (fragment) [Syntrophobacter sp. SbD1]